MRRRVVGASMSVCLLLAIACSEDEAAADLDAEVGLASLDGSLAQPRGDAARPRDSGPAAAPVIAAAQASSCGREPLLAPAELCELSDPSEPNTHRMPARLELGSTCGFFTALAADKDEDAYRFTADKSDPVRVELSYTAEQRADLALDIRDRDDRVVARVDERRVGPHERVSKVLRAAAGVTYDVQVDGANIGLCQTYSLRVDTRYCTDWLEDNDEASSARPLVFAHDQTVRVEATSHEGDPDFYEYVTERADPVLIAGSYTAGESDGIRLRRLIGAAQGATAIDETGERTGTTARFSHWMRSPQKGSAFRIQIEARGSGCAQYDLTLDASACTDAFEDNDASGSAAPLALGHEVQATAFFGDADFYDLSALHDGGRCVVTYTVATGTAQRLRGKVSSASQGIIASAVGATGAVAAKTLELSWQGRAASVLEIAADQDGVCQPYSLRCDALATPQ